MKINKNLMSINHTACKRTKADIQYIFIHYVGALGDAKANTDYYKSTNVGASADFWVGFAGDIWQGNDYWNYYSWAVGGSGNGPYINKAFNSNSVSIEMCVRKKNTATMNATDKDWYFEDATVESAAELTAYLMKELDIDIDHVIRHYDRTGKICPNPFVYNTGKVTWDGFKQKVMQYYNGTSSSTELYRIRKAWKDEASQIGAYESLENAKKNCPPGYSVYNSAGKMVYTVKTKGTQGSDLAGLSEKAAIKKVAPLYQAVQKSTGMLASVGLAQFCLESAYGSSELAQQANNLHGMKCELSGNTWSDSTWDGKSRYTKKTTEQDSKGNATQVTADFRKYECLEDSIADRAAYFIGAKNGSKLRYPGIAKITDAKKQIELIKSGGYATDVNYVDKLYSLVTKWDLTQYDIIIPYFEVGKKYKLLVDNYIRETPSGGYVGYEELSSGVKKKVVRQGNKVKLKANNVVEAKEVRTTDDGNIWIRIKSGWLAAYVSGTVRLAEYVKDSSSANTDEEEVTFQPYSVQITSADVNIRAGAGTNYASKGFTGKGTFTIVDEATDTSGRKWGLFKAYESKRNGWIALWLDCVK